jgi:hypothetical protein
MTAHYRHPRYEFGPEAIEVGRFILERRRRGDCTMAILEGVNQSTSSFQVWRFEISGAATPWLTAPRLAPCGSSTPC